MAESKYKVELTKRYGALVNNSFDAAVGDRLKVVSENASKIAGAVASTLVRRGISKAISKIYQPRVYEDDPGRPTQKSLLGTPLFDFITVKMNDGLFEFPNDPLVEWEMQYDHNMTELTGGGEVVETSGEKPISFRLQGFLWDGSGHYPEGQLKDFLICWRKNAVMEVSGRLFNLLDVKSILVERAGFTAEKGFEDTQYFEIYCRSYKPVELEILAN